jgi:hypothetical protein
LILKVGSSSTPEHSNDSHGIVGDDESMHSVGSLQPSQYDDRQHKKNKKKKKKKEKDKDRDKHDKKKKHHHKVGVSSFSLGLSTLFKVAMLSV